MKEGGGDESKTEEERIIERAKEVKCANGKAEVFEDAHGNEDLGAVGDETLDGAGGGI